MTNTIDYEWAEPKIREAAKASWDRDKEPAVKNYDRHMILLYVLGDLALEADVFDLATRQWEDLPVTIQWRIALLLQRTVRFIRKER